MNPRTYEKLQKLHDQFIGYMCSALGVTTYEEAIEAIREGVKSGHLPPVGWLHKNAGEMYPAAASNTLRPEDFDAMLGQIATRDKATAILRSLPDSAAPQIEGFYAFLLKNYLPSVRAQAKSMVKALPHRTGGGRPKTKMPDEAACHQICTEINALNFEEGEPLGIAQQRVARSKKLTLRMVQRIWSQRAGPRSSRTRNKGK